MQTAREQIEQAQAWRESHPDMWNSFAGMAIYCSNKGIKWSARHIADRLRWDSSFKKNEGEKFKVPNSITSVLGRMVCEEYPSTAKYFIKSKSKSDQMFGGSDDC